MAKKEKPKKTRVAVQKSIGGLEEKPETKVKFKIMGISLDKEQRHWLIKLKRESFLGKEVSREYRASVEVDEEHFKKKISEEQFQKEKVEREPDMFENWKQTVASHERNIEDIKEKREKMIDAEIPNFDVEVQQVDFTKDILVVKIHESVIKDFIDIRLEFECFVVNLK